MISSGCLAQESTRTNEFLTVFEQSKGLETATYQETIQFYEGLAKKFPVISIETIGETDSGYPLHMITLNPERIFDFEIIRKSKRVLLINNGIHPGESDGIDATMMLYRDITQGKIEMPKHTVLVTIPIYNIGGSLNRNSTTRTNQNGPVEYGFRGNARNFDLNRDFIKSDTKNARAFAQIFHLVQPDVFIDNHVSNGADYQYTLTHLFTQHDKLGGDLGKYLHSELMPTLEQKLEEKEWDITPYVNVFNQTPESGFSQFFDSPRYSTGYTTLWNTLGMMVETHMLKPYKKRVEGTYRLMEEMIAIAESDGKKIRRLRAETKYAYKDWGYYPTSWAVDTTRTTTLNFKGYEGDTLTSEITGFTRLKYDRNKPFTKKVDYQNFFKPIDSVKIPTAYILKRGWSKIVTLLDLNEIEYTTLQNDTIIPVESYRIDTFETSNSPYEGHYPHYGTKVSSNTKKVKFQQGDLFIPTDQIGIRYLLETLEPAANDSYFNWNFFDTVLQQKEGFSPYVFEDEALRLLNEDENLRNQFELKKTADPEFAASWYNQLDWLFKKSRYYEEAHMQYPVYRIVKTKETDVN